MFTSVCSERVFVFILPATGCVDNGHAIPCMSLHVLCCTRNKWRAVGTGKERDRDRERENPSWETGSLRAEMLRAEKGLRLSESGFGSGTRTAACS